jgi:hypothetical protein
MGINNGGPVLVARADQVSPVLSKLYDVVRSSHRGNDPLGLAKGIAYSFTYPSNYIGLIDAKKNHSHGFEIEQAVYNLFKKEFYSSYANFTLAEIGKKPTREIINSMLKIFLSSDSKLGHEIIGDGTTLRIFQKPSSVVTFFTGRSGGETVGSTALKSITDIQVSEKQLQFFNRSSNFMTITRERCYSS